jgi:hypothetical protein
MREENSDKTVTGGATPKAIVPPFQKTQMETPERRGPTPVPVVPTPTPTPDPPQPAPSPGPTPEPIIPPPSPPSSEPE